MASTALILLGHGSHISPHTAGLVWEQVDALRSLGVADEITASFWKEIPSFHQVLATVTAEDITLVPLFTAQGYFTRTVIPAEMELAGTITHRDGRTIRYTLPLGEHPSASHIVRRRIEDTLAQANLPPAQTAIGIIAHGTRRNPQSRDAAFAQTQLLQEANLAAEVVTVFLDDSPSIPELYTLTHQPNIIAMPYFVALGSHTTLDIPAKLGLPPGQSIANIQGRTVYYTLPVGDSDELPDAILELSRSVDAPLYPPRAGSPWQAFPTVGRDALLEAITQAGKLIFGELLLSLAEVCPIQKTPDSPVHTIETPAALRRFIRETPFRPLATSRDLPNGWHVPITDPNMLHAVVETIYPGAVADWAHHRHASFTWTSLPHLAARQTGMYQKLAELDAGSCAESVAHVCGNCVRHPTWFYADSPPNTIPCGEACNYWMSRTLESSPS